MRSKIKQICSKKGMSIYRLSKVSGISAQAFNKWEHNGLGKAQFGCMVKIAKALNCELEDLYEEERKEVKDGSSSFQQ